MLITQLFKRLLNNCLTASQTFFHEYFICDVSINLFYLYQQSQGTHKKGVVM